MNLHPIITCPVTGAGDTPGKNPAVPVTPEQIAASSLEAARAGAAVVHIHVRDPVTGKASRDTALYREVVDRVRSSNVDVVINLTAGMGGDLVLGPDASPLDLDAETDCVGAAERLVHVEELRPEICSLDCGSYNFGDGSLVYVSSPDMLRLGARSLQEWGVKPELEIFDTGQLWFANQLVAEGLVEAPPLYQLCCGVRWGAPADPATLQAMVSQLPAGAAFSSFALGSMQMPWVAQSMLLGGHVRVGLEDNLYLRRGEPATNAALVERAAQIVRLLGGEVQSPAQARKTWGLERRG